jgi:hypothetical protein
VTSAPRPPYRRRRLRTAYRWLRGGGWAVFAATGVLVARAAMGRGSAFPAAAAMYGGTVAFGLGEMARLRERVLFGPAADGSPPGSLRWWLPRVILVLAVATLPAVLILGGLGR